MAQVECPELQPPKPGGQLVRLLELSGWVVTERPAIGGGRYVIAARDGREFFTAGPISECAAEVFAEALRRQRAAA